MGQRRLWSRLPEDVLRIIFEHGHVDTCNFGVAVSAVCQYWRAVAITTPRLWSIITSERRDECYHWLQRSGAVPLTVTLVNKSSEMLNSQLLRGFVANLFRIRTLVIRVLSSGNPIWIRQIFLAFDRPASQLESLTVDLSIPCPWPRVSSAQTMFAGEVPRLSTLILKLPQDESGWTAPFFSPALTHCTLAHSSDLSSWGVWSKVDNLRMLRLEDVTWSDSAGSPERATPGILVMPHLESLSLRRVGRQAAVSIIMATKTQSLTYLSIDLRHPPDRQAGLDLVRALNRCSLPLRQLRVLRLQVAATDVSQCVTLLHKLSSLERLSFYNADVDSWLDALGTNHSGELVCPRLSKLVLNLCELQYASILRLVSVRNGQGSRQLHSLRSVSLQFCWYAPVTMGAPITLPDSDAIEILLPGKWRGTSLAGLWYSEY